MSEGSEAVEAWEALYRAQVAVLRQRGDALRIRDLNKPLLLTRPSVSRLLDRLVARGLVAKSGDPDDARSTVVTLTPQELRNLIEITDKLRAGAPPNSPA